jgi:hypothetical protein
MDINGKIDIKCYSKPKLSQMIRVKTFKSFSVLGHFEQEK